MTQHSDLLNEEWNSIVSHCYVKNLIQASLFLKNRSYVLCAKSNMSSYFSLNLGSSLSLNSLESSMSLSCIFLIAGFTFVETIVVFCLIYYILLGRIYSCLEGKGTGEFQGSIRIRKTATASGSPYSFRIVRGCFYVPQNYQHSRNCEKGPPAYRPYPRRLESLTICRWNLYKGSTFSSA